MKTITALIIEDEPLSSMYLTCLLQTWCAEVEILATVTNCEEAIAVINRLQPQLAFLDIDLINCTGFDVLKGLSVHYPAIIFTAAFGDATLNLIKPSGLPYLQKPIDGEDLLAIVRKTIQCPAETLQQQLQLLLQRLEGNSRSQPICAETVSGSPVFINVNDIICIEADGARTVFTLLESDAAEVVNLSLKDCESILDAAVFCRVSQKHIINLLFAENFIGEAEPYVLMKNKLCIPVAAKKVEAVKAMLS